MSSEAVEGHGAARNTAYAVGMLATSAIFSAGLAIFLIRRLGPNGYGILAVAVSVGTLVALPSDFGAATATARFVAESRGDRQRVADILLGGLRLKVIAGVICCGALFVLADPIASAYDVPALATPIRWTAVAVFTQGVGAFLLGCYEALRLVRLNFLYAISESISEAAATVLLVLIGAGAAGATAGRAVGFTVGMVLAIVMAFRLLGKDRLREALDSHREHVGKIVRYGIALLIVDGALTLFNRMDVLIIGAYKGTAAAGTFEAAMRLVTVLQYGGLALTPGFAPRLSQGRSATDVSLFWSAFRAVILIQLLFLSGLVVWAKPIATTIFGADFGESAGILRALGPYMVLYGIAPLLTIGVNYLGEARRRVPLAIAAVIVNLVIDLALVPSIGPIAGAIGSAAAFLVYVPGHLFICRAEVGMPGRRLLATVGRGLLACAAAAALLFAIGTSELSVAQWAAGLSGAPLVFGTVLLATGEVTRDNIEAGVGRIRLGWENRS